MKSNPRSTIICRNIMQACPENAISAITHQARSYSPEIIGTGGNKVGGTENGV